MAGTARGDTKAVASIRPTPVAARASSKRVLASVLIGASICRPSRGPTSRMSTESGQDREFMRSYGQLSRGITLWDVGFSLRSGATSTHRAASKRVPDIVVYCTQSGLQANCSLPSLRDLQEDEVVVPVMPRIPVLESSAIVNDRQINLVESAARSPADGSGAGRAGHLNDSAQAFRTW